MSGMQKTCHEKQRAVIKEQRQRGQKIIHKTNLRLQKSRKWRLDN